MARVFSAPLEVSGTTSAEIKFSEEQAKKCRSLSGVAPETTNPVLLSCTIPLSIGVFFDGTSNNRDRDEPDRAHSNVARLFNAHPSADAREPELRREDCYRIYVPGLGSRFDENKEFAEDKDGKSCGKGGQARILYGVIQVFNAIHSAFSKQQPLYDAERVAAELRRFRDEVQMTNGTAAEGGRYEQPRPTRDSWLQDFNQTMAQAILKARKAGNPLPHIPVVTVNVFGFSRGAAEAAAFCHWLHAALINGRIADIRVRIGFVGLFDCVASVGLADSARRASGAAFADGHFDWAAEVLKPLPALVEEVVHMVAAHEQRLNFPLTRVRASNLTEIVYPGMHSDVGGGYGLRSQGRSLTDGELLSQLPLIHMHRAARASYVPLVTPPFMPERTRRDYDLNALLSGAWNSYMEALNADYQAQQPKVEGQPPRSIDQCTDFNTLVRHHMRLFYAVRARYRKSMPNWFGEQVISPNPQEREDLVSYNDRLDADLQLLKYLKEIKLARPSALEAREVHNFINGDITRDLPVNSVFTHVMANGDRALQSDRDWIEKVAYPVLSGVNPVRGADIRYYSVLVGRYMHDSLAGFYLAGYSTLEEKSMKLVEVLNKQENGEPLNAHEKEIADNYARVSKENAEVKELVDGYRKGRNNILKSDLLRPEKLRALEAFDKAKTFEPDQNKKITNENLEIFPKVLKDSEADLLLNDGIKNTAVHFISNGRRDGGGYLLPRAIFPLEQ